MSGSVLFCLLAQGKGIYGIELIKTVVLIGRTVFLIPEKDGKKKGKRRKYNGNRIYFIDTD